MLKAKLIGACVLACCAIAAQAAGLECPVSSKGGLDLSASQARLLAQGGDTDASNEISDLIVSLKTMHPDLSYDGLTNDAVAAICPAVASAPIGEGEKRRRLTELVSMLRKQLSSEAPPRATSILAQVQISPEVYRSLRERADQAGQTPSQFMAAVLSKAASAQAK
jgi:hypothetical protein